MNSVEKKSIGLREYYRDAMDAFALKLERGKLEYDSLVNSIAEKRNELVKYLDEFKFPIIDYPEFQKNKYINGRLIDAAIGMYNDNRLDLEQKGRCYRLLSLAKAQKRIHDLTINMAKWEKILKLTNKQYNEIIKTFYVEVQRQLVVNGYGYQFDNKIGWICFNRVIINNMNKRMVDYNATKLNRIKIINEGGRIYNKEEAEWCKNNNITYDGVDPTVYKNDDCWYEYCLLGSKIPGCGTFKFTHNNYRHRKYKGKTTEDILATCNSLDDVMNLEVSVRDKLMIALKLDKTLYTKFIRNENQTASTFKQNSRKG